VTDLESATALVGKIASDLAAIEGEIAHLTEAKRAPALAAAQGDVRAGSRLSKLNGKIREHELRRDDLGSALEQARVELSAAEAAEQAQRDEERAQAIEEAASALWAADLVVDRALQDLGQALHGRDQVALRLAELLPAPLGRDLYGRVRMGPLVLAAAGAGLAAFLGLKFTEPHHRRPLRELHPLGEVTRAVAELRKGPAGTAAEAT
jgi:hypothetical protein